MNYKSQGLFELSSKLPFGKHKGKSIARLYSGDASELIWGFMDLMNKSLELILSTEFYELPNKPEVIHVAKLVSGWVEEEKRVNIENVIKFVSAIRGGMICVYNFTSKKIRIEVKDATGKIDASLSKIGCEIAKEYIRVTIA